MSWRSRPTAARSCSDAIVAAAIERGARLAEPGEFTLRAFLNGRMDLMQAEAVADLIDAATPLQARAAFDQLSGTLTRAIGEIDATLFDLIARLEASVDFPDEGYHFVDPGALAASIDVVMQRTDRLLAEPVGAGWFVKDCRWRSSARRTPANPACSMPWSVRIAPS